MVVRFEEGERKKVLVSEDDIDLSSVGSRQLTRSRCSLEQVRLSLKASTGRSTIEMVSMRPSGRRRSGVREGSFRGARM